MKKRSLLLFLLLGSFCTTKAQYYYKDIFKTQRTNREFQINKHNQTKKIRIRSYNSQNQPIEGFFFQKLFDSTQNKTITVSKSSYSAKNFTTAYFDDQNRLYYTIDSSAKHTNSTRIFYGSSNRIDSIIFLRFSAHQYKDSIYDFQLPDTTIEKHLFFYSSTGDLTKMERWKNNHLYKTVYYTIDSSGNVFKEYEKQKARPLYYYKYKEGMLTDVFHFSYSKRKMIPDYLLNYNDKGQMIQKTVVMADQHDYLEWHYTYNKKGQNITQKGYNNRGELQGSLKYKYFKFH